jgi:hypothetical protein
MRKTVAGISALFLLIVVASSAFAQSCPMCKESMTAAGAKLSEGFYLSIMSMFFLPFAIGGAIASMVFMAWFQRTHPGTTLPFPKALRAAWRERKEKLASQTN